MQLSRPRLMKLRAVAAFAAAVLVVLVTACNDANAGPDRDISKRTIQVTTTTNFITDLVEEIGGDRVKVKGLMGPGVDPHLYKASAGDVTALRDADAIFYGGLELEGRMSDLLIEMASHKTTVAVTRDIPESKLRQPSEFEGRFDPHVWFSVPLWRTAAGTVAQVLADIDPAHAEGYRSRAGAYDARLARLDSEVHTTIARIPERQRVLVTSHDAFGYFGDTYDIDVVAIQGTSTQTEATTADIERVAKIIADRGVKAVFIETSVPRQTIDAVLAAARRRGAEASVGGELFADAAGDPDTPEGTYIGMVTHNATLISNSLQ